MVQSAPLVASTRRPSFEALGLAADRPLLIVDVDEVLGLFVAAFGRFIESRGLEFRLLRFSLSESIYRPGETGHLDAAEVEAHLQDFFRLGCGDIEPTPGAAQALRSLSRQAGVVILSNAPPRARLARARWLGRHGLDYPLVLGDGPKGPIAAVLADQTSGPTAFVDDLLPNLDSVAEAAPAVHRFQHVADPRLRPLAPSAPERHPRIDHWPDLEDAIAAAISA